MKKYDEEKKVKVLMDDKLINFNINREMTVGELKDTPMSEFNFSMHEFVKRKWEYLKTAEDEEIIYYGHDSNNLGYFILEGEIIND